MLLKLQGMKMLVISIVALFISGYVIHHFQTFWQPWQNNFAVALYAVCIGVTAFSLQFNQSRFSYLTLMWLAHFIIVTQIITSQTSMLGAWLNQHYTWYVLTVTVIFAFLSFAKDRGIFSVHLFTRLLAFITCGLAVYLWQFAMGEVFSRYLQHYANYQSNVIEYAIIAVALALTCWRAVRYRQFVLTAIFISSLLWLAINYLEVKLPVTLTIIVFVSYCLLVMILDSYFLAYRDELTTLPSRRALNNLALSLGRSYTVAMLDIDHFKKFNDTYGHDIGDQVLKLVAAKLKNVKGGGKVFRYGGEEFTVVFSGKSPELACEQLEQLRQAIADYKMIIRQPQRAGKQQRGGGKMQMQQKTVSVTISIGVAARQSKQSFEQVIKVADQALYRAKKKGRNNVSL